MLYIIAVFILLFILLLYWGIRPWVHHRRTLNFAEAYAMLENFVETYLSQYMHEKTGYDTMLNTTILHPTDYERIIIETTKYVIENMPSFVIDEAMRYMSNEQINSVVFIKTSNELTKIYEVDMAGSTEQTSEVSDGDAY